MDYSQVHQIVIASIGATGNEIQPGSTPAPIPHPDRRDAQSVGPPAAEESPGTTEIRRRVRPGLAPIEQYATGRSQRIRRLDCDTTQDHTPTVSMLILYRKKLLRDA